MAMYPIYFLQCFSLDDLGAFKIHYRQIWRLLKGNFECQLSILPLSHVEVMKTMVCLLGKLTLTHNRLMAFYPGGPVPEETFTYSHPS